MATTYPFLSCGTNITRYVWGLDISGQSGGRASSQAEMQGAGGVGGLCAVFSPLLKGGGGGADGGLFYGITPYYPCYDANGNITEYVDITGNTVAHYEYDAFGNTVSQIGSMADDFKHRFSTKYLDAETGLYGYGERYYNPVLGRFISRDPIEEQGGLNLYGFCGNDPINRWDYLGMASNDRVCARWALFNTMGGPLMQRCVEWTTAGELCANNFCVIGSSIESWYGGILSCIGIDHVDITYDGKVIYVGGDGGAEIRRTRTLADQNNNSAQRLSKAKSGVMKYGKKAEKKCSCAGDEDIRDCLINRPKTKGKNCQGDVQDAMADCCLSGWSTAVSKGCPGCSPP